MAAAKSLQEGEEPVSKEDEKETSNRSVLGVGMEIVVDLNERK